MTKIKFCGLKREEDISFANIILPDYIGFVFAKKSKRYVTPEKSAELKEKLDGRILSVGVFVNENPKEVAELLNKRVIDLAQLHGNEDEEYIRELKSLTSNSIIKAFSVTGENDVKSALQSKADFILLDSPLAGSGKQFNWNLLKNITVSYFLAGGLNHENVFDAVQKLKPYAVDVSSGIETDGFKDFDKMKRFAAVRKLKGI